MDWYRLLASEPWFSRIAWGNLVFFFSDERAVPAESADSNYGSAQRELLGRVHSAVYPMPALEEDTASYARAISEQVGNRSQGIPSFDLVVLGMGEDGHTASLFPQAPSLEEDQQWVVMTEAPQNPRRRMTFTYPLLNAAQRVWVLAPGQGKEKVAQNCLRHFAQPESRLDYPINGVRPTTGELIWWLTQ